MSAVEKPLIGTPLNTSHHLARGLLGVWLMSEGRGATTADSSGNRLTGTFQADAGWTDGQGGYATTFDGTSDYIDCGNPVNNSISELTAIVLCRNTVPAQTGPTFFGKGTYFTDGFTMNYDRDFDTRIKCSVGGQFVFIPDIMAQNEWVTLAISYKQNAWGRVYKNGLLIGNLSANAAAITQTRNITFGANHSGAFEFAGDVEYGLYYNRALLTGEIQSLYIDLYQMFRRDEIEWWGGALGEGGLSIPIAYHHYKQQMGVA